MGCNLPLSTDSLWKRPLSAVSISILLGQSKRTLASSLPPPLPRSSLYPRTLVDEKLHRTLRLLAALVGSPPIPVHIASADNPGKVRLPRRNRRCEATRLSGGDRRRQRLRAVSGRTLRNGDIAEDFSMERRSLPKKKWTEELPVERRVSRIRRFWPAIFHRAVVIPKKTPS